MSMSNCISYEHFETLCNSYYQTDSNLCNKKILKECFQKAFQEYPGIMDMCDICPNIYEINGMKKIIESHIHKGKTRTQLLMFYDEPPYDSFCRFIFDLSSHENNKNNNEDTNDNDENKDDYDEDKNDNDEEDEKSILIDVIDDDDYEIESDAGNTETSVSDIIIPKPNVLEDIIEPTDDINPTEFVWKENQIEGIQNTLAVDFINGIHSQATGTGKSLMALNIIWKYHLLYPNNSIMWLCERKDIPTKLFFDRTEKNGKVTFIEEYRKWRKCDIINMWNFHVIDLTTCKPANWVQMINQETNKPKFIIVNRAFLTTNSSLMNCKYRYQEILNDKAPKLIIHDECHSTPAQRTYEMMIHAIEKWQSKIQGLSATPYREGTTKKKVIDSISKWNATSNIDRLINIYPNPTNNNSLHLLSQCELKRAIEEGYILEPVFHWFYCYQNEPNENEKSFRNSEIFQMMTALNNMMQKCTYKKVLIWCKYVKTAEEMYNMFNENRNKFQELKNITSFIFHSRMKNTDESSQYDDFYNFDLENNPGCIMFCANMFREGSDIPQLCGALFADKVKERSDIPFIQSIGRVLRTDPNGLKDAGHILDYCPIYIDVNNDSSEEEIINDNNNIKIISIMNRLIKYYLKLYELSLTNIQTSGTFVPDLSKIKVKKYIEILNSFKTNPESETIEIQIKNNKKITIDVKEMKMESINWSQLLTEFQHHWEKQFNFNDKEDFMKLCYFVKQKQFKTKEEYNQYRDEFNFPINPDIKYSGYWKGWTQFLGIDISLYPKSKNDLIQKCKALNIKSVDEYFACCDNFNLPVYPEDLYNDFISLFDIFHSSTRQRLLK